MINTPINAPTPYVIMVLTLLANPEEFFLLVILNIVVYLNKLNHFYIKKIFFKKLIG